MTNDPIDDLAAEDIFNPTNPTNLGDVIDDSINDLRKNSEHQFAETAARLGVEEETYTEGLKSMVGFMFNVSVPPTDDFTPPKREDFDTEEAYREELYYFKENMGARLLDAEFKLSQLLTPEMEELARKVEAFGGASGLGELVMMAHFGSPKAMIQYTIQLSAAQRDREAAWEAYIKARAELELP